MTIQAYILAVSASDKITADEKCDALEAVRRLALTADDHETAELAKGEHEKHRHGACLCGASALYGNGTLDGLRYMLEAL